MPSFVWAVSSTQSWIAIYKRTHQIYQALALNYQLPMRHQTYQQKRHPTSTQLLPSLS